MVDARLRQMVIRGEYWVDPMAVAEAILGRIGDWLGHSAVLEAPQAHLPTRRIAEDDTASAADLA